MRLLRGTVVIVTAVLAVITAVLGFKITTLRNGPGLTCNTEGDIFVECDVTDEELLSYVNAYDNEDGNISDKIVVQRKTYWLEKGKTSVEYSVCDSDNNVAKMSKNIVFTDYESPRIKILDSLILKRGEKPTLNEYFKTVDKFDGDISSKIKLISPYFSYLVEGTYDVSCKVSNSFSDVCNIDINIIVSDVDYEKTKINLNDYIIYVKKGENVDFDYRANIKNITNADEYGFSADDVSVESESVDFNKAGTYDVFYKLQSGGKTVGMSRMFVVVEEA